MGAEVFGPQDVPRTVALGDLRGVSLSAEEGYLLSRIDGRLTVSKLVSLVGWPTEKTHALLETLLRKHVVNFDNPEIHERVFGKSSDEPKIVVVSPQVPGEKAAPEPANPAASSIDPATIEKVPDLDEERCVQILVWEKQVMEATTVYEAFGVPEGADVRSVKRRYREMALHFHPDRFFRKEIGGYRARIDAAWARVQEAYDILTDESRRAALTASGGASARPGAAAPGPSVAPSWKQEQQSGPARSPAGTAQPLVLAPLDDFESTGPVEEEIPLVRGAVTDAPRPRMDSTLQRRMKAEVQRRIEKAKEFFAQAQLDLKDGRVAAADSNAKLAMQYDPLNDEYKEWYEAVKPRLEEEIVKAQIAKGRDAAASGDGKIALQHYEQALSQFPDSVAAAEAVGILLSWQEGEESLRRARELLQKVVNRRPRNLDALIALAVVLRKTGMVKNAQRVLEQAKTLAPKDPRVIDEAKELKRAT